MTSHPTDHSDDLDMQLDETAIEQARNSALEAGAARPTPAACQRIVELLNASLATELVCVLRYRRHHFTAKGLSSPAIAAEFLVHANEELAHADRIAERIVQLGGTPDLCPARLLERSHADYDESTDLKAMVRADLAAERVAVETYRQIITRVAGKDPTTRRMLEDILAQEEAHANELEDLL
jgi:bacterioferritin